MKLKPGIIMDGIQPPMLRACAIIDEIYMRIARHEVTLTSLKDTDPGRVEDTLHNSGLAGDFRTRDVTPSERVLILDVMRWALSPPYEIYDEGDHFHVEHDTRG
jgi:hypothetical protein